MNEVPGTAVPPPEQEPAPAHPGWHGFLAIALAALLWAVAATAARSLFEDGVSPLELSQARAYLAFAGFLALQLWRSGRPRAPLITGRAVALGASIALVNAAYYVAIERLAVAVAIVIQYTAPALVVAWLALVRRKMPEPRIAVAVVLALAGVALAAEVATGEVELQTVGLAAAGSSAILFAAYTVLSQTVAETFGPLGAMVRAFAVASLFWIVFQIPQGVPAALLEPANVVRVLYVGIAGTLAPFLLYVWGIRRVQAERAVIGATLEPPFAAVVAWLWLGQGLTVMQAVGGGVVLGAVLALQLPQGAASSSLTPIREEKSM